MEVLLMWTMERATGFPVSAGLWVACVVVGMLLTGGCQTAVRAPAPGYAPGEPPLVMMQYFPYGPALVRDGGLAPVPDYSGWTEERMVRDLWRMEDAGVDIILVVFDLADVHSQAKLDRYAYFLRLAEERGKGIRVAFMVERGSAVGNVEAWLTEFVKWHVAAGLGSLSVHFRLDGRAGVILGPGLYGFGISHPAFSVRAMGGLVFAD